MHGPVQPDRVSCEVRTRFRFPSRPISLHRDRSARRGGRATPPSIGGLHRFRSQQILPPASPLPRRRSSRPYSSGLTACADPSSGARPLPPFCSQRRPKGRLCDPFLRRARLASNGRDF